MLKKVMDRMLYLVRHAHTQQTALPVETWRFPSRAFNRRTGWPNCLLA